MSSPMYGFINGTGRCGSTLVHEVLARHSAAGFLTNVQDRLPWLPMTGGWSASLYRASPSALSRKGRVRLAPSEGYRVLTRRVSPLVVAPGRSLTGSDASPWLTSRFTNFFADCASAQGKPVFLHKFTGWPRVGFIERALPGARYINVVRDGRAVANSLLQMPWWRDYHDAAILQALPAEDVQRWEDSGRSFALLAAIMWKLEVEAHERAREEVPDSRWLEVRYEDILQRPRDEFRRMLGFFGLGWDGSFERRFARQRFHATRSDAYRRDLNREQVRMLEDVIGESLRCHGYDL